MSDDLLHECIMILIQYDENKMNEIIDRGHTKFFFVSIVINQWSSGTSPFYKLYKKSLMNEFIDNFDFKDDDGYDYDKDKLIELVQSELSGETWYLRKLLELKVNMSYSEINKLTKIPRSSLHSTVSKFKNKLNKKLKDGGK